LDRQTSRHWTIILTYLLLCFINYNIKIFCSIGSISDSMGFNCSPMMDRRGKKHYNLVNVVKLFSSSLVLQKNKLGRLSLGFLGQSCSCGKSWKTIWEKNVLLTRKF
jgi:hypothetical protein